LPVIVEPLNHSRTRFVVVKFDNNNRRLNRQCLAWNEMRLRPLLDIKAGGVGLFEKLQQTEINKITLQYPILFNKQIA